MKNANFRQGASCSNACYGRIMASVSGFDLVKNLKFKDPGCDWKGRMPFSNRSFPLTLNHVVHPGR
jgi:hypothetical protein